MNKETENKTLESILGKLNSIDARVNGLEKQFNNPGAAIATWVAPIVRVEIANAIKLMEQNLMFDTLQQRRIGRGYYLEGARSAIFFAVLSVLVSSLFTALAFLVMALGAKASVYWGVLAVPVVFIILALCLLSKSIPQSVKIFGNLLMSKWQNQSITQRLGAIFCGLTSLSKRTKGVKKPYQEDRMVSVSNGFIKEADFAISVCENDIKREREKSPPDKDRIAALEEELADLKKRKSDYQDLYTGNLEV